MRIEVSFSRQPNLSFVGRIAAGLCSLPHVQVRFRAVDWIRLPLSIGVDDGSTKLAINLSDYADLWDTDMLDWCDVYAKRSLSPTHPGPAPHKVIPYGLHLACRSGRSTAKILVALGSYALRPLPLYQYLVAPHWKDYEYRPDEPVEMKILAQTRLWEPHHCSGDEGINFERIGLLRALRCEFGQRFVGGMVPTPVAQKLCPELITALPCRQPQYIRWAKKPALAIYFRGLFDSIGFKMAEYLAASKCIVSEPITNLLPEPITHAKVYRSVEECLATCDALLSSPKQIREMRLASWEYYRRNVQPLQHMIDLLATAGRAHASLKGENNQD